MSILNLFPIRVPIGTVTDSAGNSRDVLMTPEFARALAAVLQRIGGTNGTPSQEIEALAIEAATLAAFELDHLPVPPPSTGALEHVDHGAEVAALREDISQLRNEVAMLKPMADCRAELEQLRAELAMIKPATDFSSQLDEIRGVVNMIEDPAALVRYIITTAAPLKSPTFSGIPAAPTAAVGNNTTQLATTAYSLAMLGAPPVIGSVTPAAGKFTFVTASGAYSNTSDLQFVAVSNIPGINLRSTSGAGGGRFSLVTAYIANDTTSILLGAGAANPGTEAMRFNHSDGSVLIPTSSLTVATKFGCNGKGAQAAVASGGTLAGVISALVANGILSS
jgi:hypothetical protein